MLSLMTAMVMTACTGQKAEKVEMCIRDRYDRTGSDDRSFTDHGMVQYDRAHPDQGAVAYLCPVDRDVVADRHIVADLNRRFFV